MRNSTTTATITTPAPTVTEAATPPALPPAPALRIRNLDAVLVGDRPDRNRAASPVLAMEQLRNDYQAAKSSRFRRRRSGLAPSGASADYHIRNESDYLRLIEMARDLDRNDLIVSQMVDRAVGNCVQDGIKPNPQTGDDALDRDLLARFTVWAENPEACDLAGELTWADIETLALRHTFVDGDLVVLPNADTGALELVEGHRLRTPANTSRNVVHGVLLSEATRERLEYWFTREEVDPNRQVTRVSDMQRYPARDRDGYRQVFHIYNPKRVTQTRGVTAFAPMFDALAMFEDINFAKMVQQQIVSCFAIFRQREANLMDAGDPQFGDRTTETYANGGTRTIEQFAPGIEYIGAPGETLSGFSPSIPNPEFFDHVRLILQLIGLNLGLPLIIVLLDASETNFSGWRGALDQAKIGFRRNQQWLISRLHRPVWSWLIRRWAMEDRVLARWAGRDDQSALNLNRVIWNAPTWPYIEPLKDAQADALRLEKGLISPRRLHAERGRDWEEIVIETVADRSLAITTALAAAKRIKQQFPEDASDLTWRDLISIAGVEASSASAGAGAGAFAQADAKQNKPGGKSSQGGSKRRGDNDDDNNDA